MPKSLHIIIAVCFMLLVPPAYSSINNPSPYRTDKYNEVFSEGHDSKEIYFPEIDNQNVLRLFMQSVARGELIVFNKVLYEDCINPERIEYLYDIEENQQTVKVYSSLKKEMHHPALPDIRIIGVEAVLDNQGNIIEVIAHVSN